MTVTASLTTSAEFSMAATYAGILGPLATTVLFVRSVKDGGAAEPTMLASVVGLVAFAVIGYVVGHLAHRAIEESVRHKFKAELAGVAAKQAKPATAQQGETQAES
jgi:tetrahydromethanopterin S-methyltransferase subunit C